MNEIIPKDIVRDAFDNSDVVTAYEGCIGLWKSEEMLIHRYFPQGGKLLDLGCGGGRTSIPLALMGFEVVGTDISPSMLNLAKLQASRRKLKIDFREMDSMSLKFPDETFDCAFYSFNGLDHIPGYGGKLEALREVLRVLKPSAPFVFSSHRIWSPFHLRKMIRSSLRRIYGMVTGIETMEKEWGEIYDPYCTDPQERYMSFLSSARWKRVLLAAGFDVVSAKSRYRLESSRILGWLRRSLSSSNYMLFVARKPI